MSQERHAVIAMRAEGLVDLLPAPLAPTDRRKPWIVIIYYCERSHRLEGDLTDVSEHFNLPNPIYWRTAELSAELTIVSTSLGG